MNQISRWILATILFSSFVFPIGSFADNDTAARLANEAKEVLDAHFGNQAQLTEASKLLNRAMTKDNQEATVYVQAARLIIKGGHLVGNQFRSGSLEAYNELLDRALSLDPNNPKSHILKAEYFNIKKSYDVERSELDKAKSLGSDDVWLLIGYARHFRSLREYTKSYTYYSQARARGPGENLEQRNAYVSALNGLAVFAAAMGDKKALLKLIDETKNGRDPRDAWALGNLAGSLIRAGMFEEAITICREALGTMNYGAGRLTLTAALYGNAAKLTLSGKEDAAELLLKEAQGYGYDKYSILQNFDACTAEVKELLPTVVALLK